jgi:hypothetical protein
MQQASTIPSELIFDIETLVSAVQPVSLLIVGPAPKNFLQEYCAQRRLLGDEISIEHVEDGERALKEAHQQHVDMGIVLGAIDSMSKQNAGQLIGNLRDVQCGQFCLTVTLNDKDKKDPWSLIDMLGFGLRRVAEYEVDGNKLGLFKYRLKDYKRTPDWLNADNWANPEMWGKYWW